MKTPPTEHKSEWFCETCKQKEPMTPEQTLRHLELKHGIKRPFKARKRLILALDGAGYYNNSFEVTCPGGVMLTLNSTGPKGTAEWQRLQKEKGGQRRK
jgi:hypothetical protein